MQILDTIILDNKIQSFLSVLLIILFGLICKKWISRYFASLMFVLIQRRWKTVDKAIFVDLILKPLGSFLIFFIAISSLMCLKYPTAFRIIIIGYDLNEILVMISKSTLIIYFFLFVRSFIDFISVVLELKSKQSNKKSDDQLIIFFRDFAKAIASILGILLILKFGFKIDVGAVLTSLSIIGAALALAAKESIENLIASFIIFLDKPFTMGDFVKVSNQANAGGTIEEIGLRSTRIRTVDHTLITVPNKQMVDSVVDNLTMRNARRAEIKVELSHNNELKSIEEFILLVEDYLKNQNENITKSTVYITDYTKAGTVITIEYSTTSDMPTDDYFVLKQAVIKYIKISMDKIALKIANAEVDTTNFNSNDNVNLANETPLFNQIE